MKDIPTVRGRRYIASLVAQGEHGSQDFKLSVDDAHKIARSLSAFANCEGGRLLIGVKDNGAVAGVRDEGDAYIVALAASRYCRPEVDVEFTAYSVDAHTVVICASVAKSPHPEAVQCQDSDGRWRPYWRVADENIAAHPLMVRARNCTDPLCLSLDSETQSLLRFMRSHPEGIDAPDAALELSMSQRRAAALIVDLLRTGIAVPVYRAPVFKFILKED